MSVHPEDDVLRTLDVAVPSLTAGQRDRARVALDRILASEPTGGPGAPPPVRRPRRPSGREPPLRRQVGAGVHGTSAPGCLTTAVARSWTPGPGAPRGEGMTTPGPASAEHPEVPPPTGDAVPLTTEPDHAAAQSSDSRDADHPAGVYADAERADVAADEAEAARRHQR